MRVSFIPYVQGHNYSTDKDGIKYAIAVHCTANDASAEAEAKYATWRPDTVSAHIYADNNSAVQSLDTAARSWHAGSPEGNDNAVSIELTGKATWTRAQWLANIEWNIVGRALAEVCRHHSIPAIRRTPNEMRANPKVRGFYGHNDMRLAWGGTDHTCPGPDFPWDALLTAVIKYLNPEPVTPREEVVMKDAILAREEGKPEVFIGNGIIRRHIANEAELSGVQYWVTKRGGDATVYVFEPGTIGVLGVLVC